MVRRSLAGLFTFELEGRALSASSPGRGIGGTAGQGVTVVCATFVGAEAGAFDVSVFAFKEAGFTAAQAFAGVHGGMGRRRWALGATGQGMFGIRGKAGALEGPVWGLERTHIPGIAGFTGGDGFRRRASASPGVTAGTSFISCATGLTGKGPPGDEGGGEGSCNGCCDGKSLHGASPNRCLTAGDGVYPRWCVSPRFRWTLRLHSLMSNTVPGMRKIIT